MSDERDARLAELEQENARLRRLLAAQNVPGTLRHQVRNSLALMRAILNRSAETSASVAEYSAHTQGRFDALLRVQSLLISARDEEVGLHGLIADELAAHLVKEGEQATLAGPSVGLGPKSAQVLGLAFHELAVNAIKFGAMTTSLGHIDVTWSLSPDGVLALVWSETGASGLTAPEFRGFGAETLENMLRYELHAKSQLEFHPEGLRCTISLPARSNRA